MCTEYAENGLQVGLHRARHVLDSLSSWTPCTRACSHHCRVAAVCRRASYPSATRCRMPYSSLTERQSCPVPSRSLARALAAPERSRHGRRRQASVPPLLPLLQPSCACTELSIRHTRDYTSSLASPSSLQATGAAVAASSGGLEPPASVAGRLWALSIGSVPLCGLAQAPFGRSTAARRRGGAPLARVAVPGHPLL